MRWWRPYPIFTNSISIKWSQNTLKTIGIFLFAYAMRLVLLCNKKIAAREKNMAPLSGEIYERL